MPRPDMPRGNAPPQPDPAAAPQVLPTREGYDVWASIYDDEDNPLIRMEEPEVTRLLGEVEGLDIADIGCGTGRWTLKLAEAGARLTGLDFSDAMLVKARAKPGAAAVRFIHHDLSLPMPLPDATFDRVVCSLVLEHIVDLRLLFAEMRRICRPNGFVVVSAMHPAMMLRGIQARFSHPETGRDTRPQSHANTIADCIMAALQAGLLLEHIGEHAVDEALAAQSPRARKYLGWPMLLVLRLRPGP
jgi:ubiquinone/menaquinone biosynthesis C-methylase UbiE